MPTPPPSAPHEPDLGSLAAYDYALPPELIAQQPAAERSAARLLDGSTWPPVDRTMRDWPALLQPNDLLVLNDTRVIKARLYGIKSSGGGVELLVERVLPGHIVWAHLRASRSPKAGARLWLGGAAGAAGALTQAAEAAASITPPPGSFEATVLGRCGPENALFALQWPSDPLALMATHGHVPLPPYITHADSADDERRYQTVFAAKPGAVAAPTASLHLDEAMLAAIRARGIATATVTLHVGAGTFQPVRSERITGHTMHAEQVEVPAATAEAVNATRQAGGRIVAVGTTVVRSLESARLHPEARSGSAEAGQIGPLQGETSIFLHPQGRQPEVVDALLTNFHLPGSTLLMLVAAFTGHAHAMALYAHAVEQRYRFFSYGDAMWLRRARQAGH